jgi:hypothetical protein
MQLQFYNKLMADVTWPAMPISYIDVITSKMNCHKSASWCSIKS